MNGVLDRCKGIILGEFIDCGTEFTYESVEARELELVANTSLYEALVTDTSLSKATELATELYTDK